MYSPAQMSVAKKTDVVAGLILYGEEVLVAQRRSDDSGAGLWEFPGGKVESGETFEQALIREIQEELELPIQVLKVLDSHEVVTPTNKLIQLTLLVANAQSRMFVLNDHDDARWIHWKDLNTVAFLPGNKKFLISVEKFFKSV